MRGVRIYVVQGRGFLYNYLARRVQDFRRGSSRSVKNKSDMCSFNSEFHPWTAVQPSHRDTEIQPLSKGKYTPKGSPWWFVNIFFGGGKHSLLKLGSSLLSAYRHYSTTLSSGDGTRKERKRSAKSPDAREVSLALPLEKQDIYCMKKGEVSISPTASPPRQMYPNSPQCQHHGPGPWCGNWGPAGGSPELGCVGQYWWKTRTSGSIQLLTRPWKIIWEIPETYTHYSWCGYAQICLLTH